MYLDGRRDGVRKLRKGCMAVFGLGRTATRGQVEGNWKLVGRSDSPVRPVQALDPGARMILIDNDISHCALERKSLASVRWTLSAAKAYVGRRIFSSILSRCSNMQYKDNAPLFELA